LAFDSVWIGPSASLTVFGRRFSQVYRTAQSPQDDAYTLATAIFDATDGSLRVLRGNPRNGSVTHTFSFARV
jgi:hypothetical protein